MESLHRGKVLVVDDDEELCRLIEAQLGQRRHQVSYTNRADEALELLQNHEFDVTLADVQMSGMSGLALCEQIATNRPDVPVIVMTGFGSMETAIDAIRAGAHDFITKPFEAEALSHAIQRALQHRRLSDEVKRLRRAMAQNPQVDGLVGNSAVMQRLRELIARVGDSDASVLITGDSGTGKELVARALHAHNKTTDPPFVAVNCAALPALLLESELFGHVKGAFTDAQRSRDGLFIEAHGGTLFLDEIAEMPMEMQVKLLRALQERKVRPVGGNTERPFSARLVAATNRDIEAEVKAGRFREDLYYRINVVRVEVPPLRERGTDVVVLAQHFLETTRVRRGTQVVGISSAAAQKLMDYNWPGNVRELQNAMERAVAFTAFDHITVDDLPEKIRTYGGVPNVTQPETTTELLTLVEVERRHIARVLKAVLGNKTQAARVLGVDRRTLYRKLEMYQVD
ncbi:MAG TPA: sigma-54 dependent transcriptional regulator [Polyangiaceae bacterium]|nr:sigma-54 dependent transcriptional regulator [Polyangiaceae bacterium]